MYLTTSEFAILLMPEIPLSRISVLTSFCFWLAFYVIATSVERLVFQSNLLFLGYVDVEFYQWLLSFFDVQVFFDDCIIPETTVWSHLYQ